MMAWLLAVAISQPLPVIGGIVVDATGAPVTGAAITIVVSGTQWATASAGDGTWTVSVPVPANAVNVRVTAPGFAPAERTVTLPAPVLRFVLRLQSIAEQVTVSADTATARLALESSATTLDRSSFAAAPALRLDDQLRSVPGFSLFRRTSSAVANPTTQGVTLRGLSASGASRTLVVSDGVPLNDPFGAWVYWDRIPIAALQRVDVMRGASGDIHGNDALGGVIRLTTRTSRGAEAWVDAGSADSGRASGYVGVSRGAWSAGGAAEASTTDGYRVVAPEARGAIDVRANSRAGSGLAWIGRARGTANGTLRGGYFHERRGNGTPAQLNATLTRWGGASAHGVAMGGVWEARADLSVNNYRQTFSAVAAGRATERLTNLQWVGSTGAGGAASWIRQAGRVQSLLSWNGRLARADLDEASFSLAGVQSSVSRTRARQRGDGVIAQGRFDATSRLTLDAGLRIDVWRFENLADPAPPARTFVEPRAGVSYHFTPDRTLRVAWLSGFRTPTMNELYRSFRVGNTNTLANPGLGPERASGPEVAVTLARERWTGRVIAYATRLNGAVYNKTISSTAATIVRERNNGDARTIGSEIEVEWRVSAAMSVTTAWAFTAATFTSGELDGRRVPQVPRASGAVGMRGHAGAFTAAANVRLLGAQFDDDRNDFRLRSGSLVDGRVGWRWSRRLELFGAVENAFDEELDTGRTPIRTVGAPRQARAGAVVRF